MLAVPQITHAATVGTVTATPSLNLRQSAVTSADVLTSIPTNTQVDVISKNGINWYNVVYNGNSGWVSGQYLSVDTTAVTETVGTVTANPSLNLRTTAEATSALLTSIPTNAQVAIVSKNASDWYNVTYNGKTGWVSGAYLSTASAPAAVVSRGDPAQRVERRVMQVSAYTIGDEGMNSKGITASGEEVLEGRTIAADSSLPFGTQIYIPELGKTFTVTDRDSSIKGDQLDMYMESLKGALEFGTRELEVQIKY